MDVRIQVTDSHAAEIVESKLLESLQHALVQSENTNFTLSATSGRESLVGGLTAGTSYGWLLIKVLWVDDAFRNKGLGRSLMEKAESKGSSLGCHSAWLETSNPAAKKFYEALGYAVFGQLSNGEGQFPESHQRWFLKKSLGSAQ